MRNTSFLLLLLHAISCCVLVSATLSKTDVKKSHKAVAEASPAELSVLDRGLVVSDPPWKDIVKEEKRHWAQIKKTFQGPVLGYVTPWNSHGYDVAKIFGAKLTTVCPVWLQLHRRGAETFEVTGLHDHDPGWVKAVRKSSKKVRMVPRLLFDGWSYQDYMHVMESEDEIEELGIELVNVAKTEGFDGFALELWSQLGGNKRKPGPSSPLPWVRDCVLQLAPNAQWRQKILLGLNLYGLDFASQGAEPTLGGRVAQHPMIPVTITMTPAAIRI
ncbi:Chitinase domain-containing protein 1 [Liparis tanakae]|uniref:Chitinase domain-containing protein 1 n=1 Tax=Liparis tanakae TaxID=230148 RepID=A0A4Z2J9G1_9TELE|nr:Chitinase domain-containing protein 1 [Liparis tanakae]